MKNSKPYHFWKLENYLTKPTYDHNLILPSTARNKAIYTTAVNGDRILDSSTPEAITFQPLNQI